MLTDITIVLDRSGSMSSVATDTIGGFNRFLADQKAVPGEANLTLHQFDHEFETLFNGTPIKEVPELTNKTFVPRGQTALLDALGRAIINTGSRLSVKKADKVVFVILTDGHENSSHEFNQQKINEMIEHQKSKYSWEFVFLGANQDAIKTGESYGIIGANCLSYADNSAGVEAAIGSTSSNLRQFRTGQVKSMAYSPQDKDAQLKAGLKQ